MSITDDLDFTAMIHRCSNRSDRLQDEFTRPNVATTLIK